MKYYSLNNKAKEVSFKDAVIKGLAEDKGLYFPKEINSISKGIIQNINNYSNEEIAFAAIQQFVGDEIPKSILKEIITETLSFDFPLVNIEENIKILELFHGPTMAFKDVGARFMARCLGYFNKDNNNEVTVLVATSGDTGGAVASGFLGVKNVKVVILYPSKKVSEVQEKQLTTLGQNISALEVDGTFDDCQAMVKKAFLDSSITNSKQLTSANSINVARWLPQLFYFFFAYKQLKKKNMKLVFSVPSGNFGNICAGMMAKKLGLPIHQFIAATNINDVVPKYLKTGSYNPKPSHQTISNAMDVGDPSNFIRIQKIYNNDLETLKRDLHSYSFTDADTKEAMLHIYNNCNYIADPHGAVGYLGCKKYQEKHQDTQCIFLETAHPVKFLDIVEPVIGKTIDYPEQIKTVIYKTKKATFIKTYDELKSFLLSN
ncbi:threonine synthase [Aureibaculum sp. 2210JD6-5]|uniref:threonine synthase n=1 Tax=Aureibaculum sp. 2210JD6-5 TaxID=3103957 RepID=UPI002AADC46A|nr:threonine synthase [Aureibaculum sp. 2210JD6-5]MDY7394233.1 threonine synthase [Aureibaculum sp. 2210JD6-5]